MLSLTGERRDGLPLPELRPPVIALVYTRRLFALAVGRLLSGPPLNAEVILVKDRDPALDEHFDADLVVWEVWRDVHGGIGSVLEQRALLPDGAAPLLLLSDQIDTDGVVLALRSGVAGYFTQDSAADGFIAGVSVILNGHQAISDSVLERLLDSCCESASLKAHSHGLSATETAILGMLAEARSISAIASDRGISPKTVRNHVANIYRKLSVRSRTEAILRAAQMGLARLN